jgi:hypothetical protein
MLTPAQCEAYAKEYRSLAQQADLPQPRAAMLLNIARSFTGLATQLDRLSALIRAERK